jgi:hypothetical protein
MSSEAGNGLYYPDSAEEEDTMTETTHQCPPDGGGLMPCCGLTPFEVPRTGRITLDSALVTCIPCEDGTERKIGK